MNTRLHDNNKVLLDYPKYAYTVKAIFMSHKAINLFRLS